MEVAVQRIKLAMRGAVERTIESLGLAALAAHQAFQRDGLLEAQFELNRKSAAFALAFNEAYDQRVMREAGGAAPESPGPASTNWDALSLVEDREVEQQISAERFGMEIAHACEWELRELNGYVASLLGYGGSDKDRNPLRPEVVGHALSKGVDAVTDRAELRKVLFDEVGRSLGTLLRVAYAEIVADLRQAGVQPMGLSVRVPAARSHDPARSTTGRDALGDADTVPAVHESPFDSRRAAHETRSGFPSRRGPGPSHPGTPIGLVDPALMSLMRRLAYAGDTQVGDDTVHTGSRTGSSDHWGAPLANLIHAHRDELRQASTGALDHLVIDVIGSLFDQILADPKVPPQMARQVARLQVPVLRAALGDPAFFALRRHPVRRFINRLASLGSAFEDFEDGVAQRFLAKVRTLVQAVVEGDFDQIETYEQQLAELEAFIAEQSSIEAQTAGHAAEMLSQKEDEQRLRQLYAQRLEDDLKGLAGPEFVRDFISRVWSQVMLVAGEQGGADGELATRLRRAGRELFMSVQPKATPAARKAFLAELPKLMQELTRGLNLIGWPEAQRRAFFGQLMPAHAEALKSNGSSQLDINLLARQVDSALDKPMPSRAELKIVAASAPAVADEALMSSLSPEEAQRVGLVQEAVVDWKAEVAAEPDAGDTPGDTGPALPGLPLTGGTPEPVQGRALADHVQIGFAYRMQLQGQWQKVRLSYVSSARSFFVFTHGHRQQETISLTQRMLVRLCEAGRLRAFETAYLMERATARARRQLAGVAAGGGS